MESAYEEGDFGKNLDDIVEEEEMVIARLRNLAEYTIIYSKINLIFRSGGFTRNEDERQKVADIADYHLPTDGCAILASMLTGKLISEYS